MNGVKCNPTEYTLNVEGVAHDTNVSKAEIFAKKFAEISSRNNYPPEFQQLKKPLKEVWQIPSVTKHQKQK